MTLGLRRRRISAAAVEPLIMRIVDIQLSFPAILIALILHGGARPGRSDKVIVALVTVQWAYYARTVARRGAGRASARNTSRRRAASRSHGAHRVPAPAAELPAAGDRRRHGAGGGGDRAGGDAVVPRPRAADHRAVARAADRQRLPAPAVRASTGSACLPGVALLVTIVGINLVGDQLRDVLNPRLHRAMSDDGRAAARRSTASRTHFVHQAAASCSAVDGVSFELSAAARSWGWSASRARASR